MEKSLKELLLKDLCGRLPYGVKVQWVTETTTLIGIIEDIAQVGYDINDYDVAAVEDTRPYLRPMWSMTKDEKEWYYLYGTSCTTCAASCAELVIDWLNKKMFDYRGLIEKGLALEAHEGMYETK